MSTYRINGKDGVIIQSSKFLELPKGSTSTRPITSRPGMIRYNSERDQIECVLATDNNGLITNEWKGLPFLDSSGKLQISTLPDSIVSNTVYQGTWDAELNDIDISSGEDASIQALPAPGTAGHYFVVRTQGDGNNATGLVQGEAPYNVGDWIISNGTVWEKLTQHQIRMLANQVSFSSSMLTNRNKHGLLNLTTVQQALENLSEYALDRKGTDTILGDITFQESRLILDPGTEALPGLTFNLDLGTGIYKSASNTIDFSTNATRRLSINPTGVRGFVPFKLINGSAASPSYTFDSDTGSGMFIDVQGLNFSLSGTTKLTLSTSGLYTPAIQVGDGDATTPGIAFKLDPSTGIFNSGSYLGLVYKGTDVLGIFGSKIQTKKPIWALDGTPSAPAYSFNSNGSTGIYGSTDTVGVSIQGTSVLFIGSEIQSNLNLNLKSNALKWSGTNSSTISSDGDKIDFKSFDSVFNFGSNSENHASIYKDAILVPSKGAVDTTPVSGMIRFNSTKYEGYISSEWVDLSSSNRITDRGTVSAPALYFSQDTIKNTGVYSPSEGSIGFVASGTEQLRLSSNKVTSYSPLEVSHLSTTMTLTSDGTNSIISSSAPIKVTSKMQISADIGLYDNGADTRKTYFRYTDGLIVEGNQTLAQKYLSLKGATDASSLDTIILDKTLNGIYQTNTDADLQSSAVVISSSTTDYQYQLVGKLNGTTPVMRFRVGAGSTLSSWKDLVQNDGTDKFSVINSAVDSITSTGGISITGTLVQGSDIRLKTNIKKLTSSRAKLHEINGYEFSRLDINDEFGPLKEVGVIAQEIQKVQPELVRVRSDGMLTVAYGNLSAILIEATKEVDLDVQDLKAENLKLKESISDLSSKYDELIALVQKLL